MTRLEELFPDGKRRATSTVFDDRHTVRRLDQLFGDRRVDLDITHRASGRGELVRLVDDAAADAKSLASSSPPVPSSPRRSRRRIDVVGVAAAALAVIALATLGVVGGVQAATADPAGDALAVLVADERTIEGVEQALASSSAELTEQARAADARAEAVRAAVESTRNAPDPADIPPGETQAPEGAGTIAIYDEEARKAVVAAIDAYRSELAAFDPPAAPGEYTRARIDEGLLPDVASAIDAAQQRLVELDQSSASMRTARISLEKEADAFQAQLSAFTATAPATAQKVVDANPDAEQRTIDALIEAAKALASADLTTDGGLATLSGYREATMAVVSDQVRADREREQRERDERQRERERSQWNPPAPTPQPDPDPSAPPNPAPTAPPSPAPDDPDDSGTAPEQ